MKKSFLIAFLSVCFTALQSQVAEQEFLFQDYRMELSGSYSRLLLDGTQQTGLPGEPSLPWHEVALLLPPGEAASRVELIFEEEIPVPGSWNLMPQQRVLPLSYAGKSGFLKNETVYQLDTRYPETATGKLVTHFLNGHAIAMTSFTPAVYHPASGTLSFFRKVTVRIHSQPDAKSTLALRNLRTDQPIRQRLGQFIRNPGLLETYATETNTASLYQMLIITPNQFMSGFQDLIDHYQSKAIISQVVTTETIDASVTGQDLQEKIRNYIIQEYQNNGIEYVLLGGDAEKVPYRGFWCQVQSSSIYEDNNIPADLYYSALDGTWNDNGNSYWGEPGEDDLLPDVAVTRFPVSNNQDLENMIHKSISYQENPVNGELDRPFMVGEHMWDDPLSFGSDYLELLIGDRNDNGYFTHGIPEAENDIERLYDTLISLPANYYNWQPGVLMDKLNQGKSFIHHAGHSNEIYMMRLFIWDINNQNFSQVNGTTHNYQLMYTHGCLCGAFDVDDCIAETCVTLENFLVAGVFNSRYGWFNEGQTEGPSAHLHREFVSAMYHDTIPMKRIGVTHMQSKIKTAPWVTAPGQWEPGALRWCFYDCNVFGDPAMEMWTDNAPIGIDAALSEATVTLSPNPASGKVLIEWMGPPAGTTEISLLTIQGQIVYQNRYTGTGPLSLSVDLAGMAPGIYFVRLTADSNTHIRKLIVE